MDNLATIGRAIAVKAGWIRRKSGDKFQVVLEFKDPPPWPIDVVWKQMPIFVSLQPPNGTAP